MHPLLSIVSGTYNRLDYLRAMVESVRHQLPVGMDYEFVLVDGGSTDGTDDWARQQPDTHFIQQGALLGAIRAFDAGCESAQGDYVLLLNDDVLVVDGAILKALTYLDTHPDCGAVAFADKRKDGGAKSGTAYEVGTLYGLDPTTGKPTGITYAQCGLFRRWLGDLCGWWGSHDPAWGDFHTYGGDNRLSAEIWKRGYTVDAVTGCAVDDRIAPDGLRERNHQQEQRIGSAYMRAYGSGVPINRLPKPINPQRERLRILYLPLFSGGYGRYKHGLYDAFANVGWTVELNYAHERQKLPGIVKSFQPHLVFVQMHDTGTLTVEQVKALRTYAPNAVWVNWCGDVYAGTLISPAMTALLHQIDLQLVVNADVLPYYAEQGIAAAYWQIGFEPVSESLPRMPSHDLLFMANVYAAQRLDLGKLLRELSRNVGLYGLGWENATGNTFYNFAEGAALYRNCKIAIGDNQYGDRGFVSNRLFEALANGAFLLHQRIPGLEELTGLTEGVHYVDWTDLDDLREQVQYYLAPENTRERQQIAAQGEAFVRIHHTFDARVKTLFEELLPRLQPHAVPEPTLSDLVVQNGWEDGIQR